VKQHIRRLASLAGMAGLLTTLTAFLAPATPASAATSPILISGNFAGDARDETFHYQPGSSSDWFQYNYRTGPNNVILADTKSATVNATYTPLVGDFDGDNYDEIFFYCAGTCSEVMWDFNNNDPTDPAPIVVGQVGPVANAADWKLTAGDYNADGTDDIFLYRASGTEVIWDFAAGSGLANPAGVTATTNAGGGYEIFSGDFDSDDTDDILFYNPANGLTYRWNFLPGGFTPASTGLLAQGPANAKPITLDRRGDGGTDFFLYVPNAAADPLWEFVNVAYTTTSGNYFGDNGDDIYFTSCTQTLIWNHLTDATGLRKQDAFGGNGCSTAAANRAGTDDGTLVFTIESDTILDPS
jgi:hypothetical protein